MPGPRLGSIVIGDDWEVRTDLSPEDCVVRLRAVAPEGWNLLSKHSVIGEFDRAGGYIRRVGFIDPLFPSTLQFRFEWDGAGTRISARSGLHWSLFVFAVLWVGVVLGQAGTKWAEGDPGEPDVVLTILFAAIGPLVLIAGGLLGRRGGGRLAAFLADAVEGRIVR